MSDELQELRDAFADLLRHHTRAAHALHGEDKPDYPEDECWATGRRAIEALKRFDALIAAAPPSGETGAAWSLRDARAAMCSRGGRLYVEKEVLRPFGYRMAATAESVAGDEEIEAAWRQAVGEKQADELSVSAGMLRGSIPSRPWEGTAMAERTRAKRAEWLWSLDPGIARWVDILDAHGVETFESCQAGEGHCFPEPTIRFDGDKGYGGWHALEVALTHGLPVHSLRRYWTVSNGEPVGPSWELTFRHPAEPLIDGEITEPPPRPAWICAQHAPGIPAPSEGART
jgi:hypothetical protein